MSVIKKLNKCLVLVTLLTGVLIYSGFNYVDSVSVDTETNIEKQLVEDEDVAKSVELKMHRMANFSDEIPIRKNVLNEIGVNRSLDRKDIEIETNIKARKSLSSGVSEGISSIEDSVEVQEEVLSDSIVPMSIDVQDEVVKEEPVVVSADTVVEKPENSKENILFIGNSLIEGIRLYTTDNNAFICKVGISLSELKSNYFSSISNYSCDTIVIGMGTNELGGYSEETFKQYYNELIDKVYSVNSNAVIYCLSVPPVSQRKSNNSSSFNNTNVKIYSGYIKSICEERGITYLDCSEHFGDVLNSNWTGDGIHLSAKQYVNWYNWILTKIS